jgi:hypothetical protein
LATRRKYRTQKLQAYRDGGAVRELGQIPDDAGPSLKAAAAADFEAERGAAELEREAAAIEREREGTAAPASPTIAPPDDGNPLLVALHASRKAEELQRQRTAAPQADHHAYVDGLQISERKKEFLRANPELMRPDLAPIARKIYQQALAAGVPDASAQIERAVLGGVMHEIGAVQRTAPAPSPPPAIEPKRERFP